MRFYSIKFPVLGIMVEAWYRVTTPPNAAVATVVERERVRRHHLFSFINLIIVIGLLELVIINAFRHDPILITLDIIMLLGMSTGLWFNRQGYLERAVWCCIGTYIIGCIVGLWTPYFVQPQTIPWGWVVAVLPTIIIGHFLRPKICLIITFIEYGVTLVYLITNTHHLPHQNTIDLNYILLYASFTILGSGICSTLYAASALEILHLADRTVELERAHNLIHDSLSALQESYADLEYEAATDPLTGVANRRAAQGIITQNLFDLQIHEQQILSVIFMDIDHFKSINDSYGHEGGDEALKHLVGLLETYIDQLSDPRAVGHQVMQQTEQSQHKFVLARMGGEEFVLILPEIATQYAMIIAERLRVLVMTNPLRFHNQQISLTISQGVATAPLHATTMTELFAQADTAMYAAKHGGRNRVCAAETFPASHAA